MSVINSILWNGSSKILDQIIVFVVGIILARILGPEDFGLIGMVLIFTSIANVFVDSGFSTALIQKSEISEIDINSVFFFNIIISFIFTISIFFSSGFLASYLGENELQVVIQGVSFSIFIDALYATHKTILIKELNFKVQFYASFFAKLISGIVAIIMAFNGYGVWSLVCRSLLNGILSLPTYWIMSNWKPTANFSISSLKSLFGFGSKLLIGSLLRTVFENLYSFFIGKAYSMESLGFYLRAKRLYSLPNSLIISTFSDIIFSFLSKKQNNKGEFILGAQNFLKLLFFITLPLMSLLYIISKEIIIVLLTEKWIGSVIFLKLFCIIGILYPIGLVNVQAILALGRSDINLKLSIIKNLLRLFNLIITIRLGLIYILIGELFVSFIGLFLNSYYLNNLISFNFIKQLKAILPILISGGSAFAVTLLFTSFYSFPNSYVIILFNSIIFAVVYGGVAYVVDIDTIILFKVYLRKIFNKKGVK